MNIILIPAELVIDTTEEIDNIKFYDLIKSGKIRIIIDECIEYLGKKDIWHLGGRIEDKIEIKDTEYISKAREYIRRVDEDRGKIREEMGIGEDE